MDTNSALDAAYRRAKAIFRSGVTQDALVQRAGKVARPIPVLGPDGAVAAWFAGITVDDRLAGFLHLDTRLELLRYSSFLRRPGSVEGCPPARSWLDPAAILEKAETKRAPGGSLGAPYLTYDQSPDRLVWAVEDILPGGDRRIIYVAGEYVYARSERNST